MLRRVSDIISVEVTCEKGGRRKDNRGQKNKLQPTNEKDFKCGEFLQMTAIMLVRITPHL